SSPILSNLGFRHAHGTRRSQSSWNKSLWAHAPLVRVSSAAASVGRGADPRICRRIAGPQKKKPRPTKHGAISHKSSHEHHACSVLPVLAVSACTAESAACNTALLRRYGRSHGHRRKIVAQRHVFCDVLLRDAPLDLVSSLLYPADVAIDDAGMVLLTDELVALRMLE